MKVERIDAAFGARARGCDLAAAGSGELEDLSLALATHGVVLLRRQALNDEHLVRLGEALGDLDFGINPGTVSRQDERIIYVSPLQDESGRTLGGQGNGELLWHPDEYFRDGPTLSLLYCLLSPAEGGDTLFASGRLAFEALPEALRERVSRLVAVYPVPEEARREGVRNQRMPLVWANPTTGGRSLYVSSKAESIDGLSPEESAELIDTLVGIQVRDEHVYRHRWRAGDLILYDNGQILHKRMAFEGLRFMKAARVLASRDRFTAPTGAR